jgi:predicted dehydrogenase
LCGYAVDLALKARSCTVLHWQGFPSTRKEFEGLSSFKVHDFDILLHLTGREAKIKASYYPGKEDSHAGAYQPDAPVLMLRYLPHSPGS